MTDAERVLELEESAEGVDLFRPPGEQLRVEQARDQAEASGWIPEPADAVSEDPVLQGARVHRDHLHEAMVALQTSIARPVQGEGWARDVDASLRMLGDALDRHIREMEAPDGLLAEIADMAPRLYSDIQTIQNEHVDLLSLWARAREALQVDDGATPADAHRQVMSLLGQLAIHRHRGSSLVYDAYNVDMEASD